MARSAGAVTSARQRRPPAVNSRPFKGSLPYSAAAFATDRVLGIRPEPLENRRQLRFDVGDPQVFAVQAGVAAFAVPEETSGLAGAALALHDEPDSICKPLRRMRYMGRQQQHVAFELVEELLARIVVVVLAGAGRPGARRSTAGG